MKKRQRFGSDTSARLNGKPSERSRIKVERRREKKRSELPTGDESLVLPVNVYCQPQVCHIPNQKKTREKPKWKERVEDTLLNAKGYGRKRTVNLM